jgi:hypothetical protein
MRRVGFEPDQPCYLDLTSHQPFVRQSIRVYFHKGKVVTVFYGALGKRTNRGIGVCSTLKQAEHAYPTARKVYAGHSFVALEVRQGRGRLILDVNRGYVTAVTIGVLIPASDL